jgi:hypothetical protein
MRKHADHFFCLFGAGISIHQAMLTPVGFLFITSGPGEVQGALSSHVNYQAVSWSISQLQRSCKGLSSSSLRFSSCLLLYNLLNGTGRFKFKRSGAFFVTNVLAW